MQHDPITTSNSTVCTHVSHGTREAKSRKGAHSTEVDAAVI